MKHGFRVKGKVPNGFYYVYEDGSVHEDLSDIDRAPSGVNLSSKKIEVSTGARDLNGIEIFEGDKVACYNSTDENYYSGRVKYCNLQMAFVVESGDPLFGIYPLLSQFLDCEVINKGEYDNV